MRKLFWASGWLVAQLCDSLLYYERMLIPIAHHVLHHDSLAYKQHLNQILQKTLYRLFSTCPQAYAYRFDSLVTISSLMPKDSSFRILTWQIVDYNRREHYYYGLVVRRWRNHPKAPWQYQVFPLQSVPELYELEDIERRTLTQSEWLGALYYHPRGQPYGVLTFEGIAKIPRGRKIRKEKVKYYVLLGWNGYDKYLNYKVVEVIYFDPRYPNKVFFGAPIFYVGPIPKMRMVFEYSENSPFSLNWGYYVPKLGSKKRIGAIIFDHLVKPPSHVKKDFPWIIWGADGSYDALEFWKKKTFEGRKGIFVYRRNVHVYAPEIESYDPKVIRRQKARELEKLRKYGLTQ